MRQLRMKIEMKILFALVLLLICNIARAGNFEEPLTGSVKNCLIFTKYIVVLESGEYAGQLIKVKKRENDKDVSCNLDAKSEPFFITGGPDSAESFDGIYKHYLFTDSGTGPDGRAVGIYDLTHENRFYYATYGNGPMEIKGNVFTFFKDIEPRPEFKCEEKESWSGFGFDAGYEQKTRVYLDSFREEAVGEIGCSPRQ